MSSDIDVDNLFSEETLGELGEIRCTPIKPAYFRANRTIIVKNVDHFIMEYSEEELLKNINDLNKDHLKAVSLFKFPSGRTFKVECLSHEMAKKMY